MQLELFGKDQEKKSLSRQRVNRPVTMEEHALGMIGTSVLYVDRYSGVTHQIYPYPHSSIFPMKEDDQKLIGFYDDPIGIGHIKYLSWKAQKHRIEQQIRASRLVKQTPEEQELISRLSEVERAIEQNLPNPTPPFQAEYDRCARIYRERVKTRF